MKKILNHLCLAIGALTFTGSLAIAKPAHPDPDMKKVLTELTSRGGKPIEMLSAEEARNQPTPTDAVKFVMANENKIDKTKLSEVRDIELQGADGKIAARLYIPFGKQPLPVVVYYHGGGFVIATNDVYDATPRSLAEQTGAIFVSVEYRKAPEHKFPAAHNDAFAAYKWVLANASTFGGDSNRVAVAGESAGGNLALNVAIAARDEGIKTPIHELLVYPVAGTDMNTKSYQKNIEAKPLNKPMMEWFFGQYTTTAEDKKDSRLNLLAADLSGLAPATIITAEIDPLQTEGKALADKLKAAGVKVQYKNYTGVTHEFFGMAPVVSKAKNAQKFAATELKKSF